jgi:tetratricopeptide (TPR) repeat protein
MLLSNKQNHQEALISYDKALKFQPDNSQIWMLRAGILRDLNQDVEAINSYTKAIKIEPRPLFFLSRSDLYSQNGQYSLAIEDLNSVIKLDPNAPQAYASRGALKKRLGDQKGSRGDYEQVQKLTYQDSDSSKFNSAITLIGLAELSVGITKEGSQAIAQGLQFGNNQMGNLLSTLLQEVYNNPGKMRDPETFVNTIDSAINGSSSSVKLIGFDAYLLRASSYLQFGLANYLQFGSVHPMDKSILEKALSEIDLAIKVGRENEQVYLAYAMRSAFQENKGDEIAARSDFDEALKSNEYLSEVYESRGLARLNLGNKTGALSDFQAASQIAHQQNNIDRYQEIMSIIDKIQSQPAR